MELVKHQTVPHLLQHTLTPAFPAGGAAYAVYFTPCQAITIFAVD